MNYSNWIIRLIAILIASLLIGGCDLVVHDPSYIDEGGAYYSGPAYDGIYYGGYPNHPYRGYYNDHGRALVSDHRGYYNHAHGNSPHPIAPARPLVAPHPIEAPHPAGPAGGPHGQR